MHALSAPSGRGGILALALPLHVLCIAQPGLGCLDEFFECRVLDKFLPIGPGRIHPFQTKLEIFDLHLHHWLSLRLEDTLARVILHTGLGNPPRDQKLLDAVKGTDLGSLELGGSGS